MSTKRQSDEGLRTFGVTTRMASMLPPQSPEWGQLFYATEGSLTVECPVGERLWYVPSRRALWVTAGVPCRLRLRGRVRLRMIYAHRSLCHVLEGTYAICVAPLLHEALLETARRGVLARDAPLTGLVVELLQKSPTAPLSLPMPRDPRALRVAKSLTRNPATQRSLGTLSRAAGAGVRTVERLFAGETGMGFAAWRQRLRMLEGMRLLLDGTSIAAAAEAVGYRSVSAFVVAFKATTGETPGRWRQQ